MNTFVPMALGQQIEHTIPPHDVASQTFYFLLLAGLITTISIMLAIFRHRASKPSPTTSLDGRAILSGVGLLIAGTIVCTAVLYGITFVTQHVMRDTDTLYSGDQLAADIEQNLYDNYAIHAATVDVKGHSTEGLLTFPAEILPFDEQQIVYADVYYHEDYGFMTIITEDGVDPIPPRDASSAYYALGYDNS